MTTLRTLCWLGAIDFVLLPGDNADNGRPAQYRLATDALDGFPHPVHAIPGDHDMEPGSLQADGSDAARLAAWEARGLLGTRLGPNRNGKQR